jgi:hypothetical protein
MAIPSENQEVLSVYRPKRGKILSVFKVNPSASRVDILAVLRNAVFFIATYLYFTGWVYVYYFLRDFGIALSSVNTPVYYFFVYSYGVMESNFFWLLLIVVGVIVSLMLCRKYKLENMRNWLVVLILAAIFPISFYAAVRTAHKQALALRRGIAKSISFTLRKDVSENYPEEFLEANSNGDLKVVFQTEDRFYVLSQPITEDQVLPIAYTFTIFKSDVQAVTVELTDSPLKEDR